jgi:hypothetical protein
MGSPGEPRRDAHSLRLQIDGLIRVLEARATRNPDHILSAGIRGTIFAIVDAIQRQYGPRLILDAAVSKVLWEQSEEGPTAEEMWGVLESLRASLQAEEDAEAWQGTYDSMPDTASPLGSAAQRFEHRREDLDSWPDEEDGREYRIGAGSQHRRPSGNRSRPRPW